MLRQHPYGCQRMTRGHRGSLALRREALSSFPFYRFIPAHYVLGAARLDPNPISAEDPRVQQPRRRPLPTSPRSAWPGARAGRGAVGRPRGARTARGRGSGARSWHRETLAAGGRASGKHRTRGRRRSLFRTLERGERDAAGSRTLSSRVIGPSPLLVCCIKNVGERLVPLALLPAQRCLDL